MTRPVNLLFVAAALFLSGALPAASQTAQPAVTSPKAAAYYHFTMGHVYAELAGSYGNRGEYLNRAIDHYKQAIKLDPQASFLVEEMTDLYVQAGRIKDAVTEAEDLLKQNPGNLSARRILGRIYSRLIGDPQQNRINQDMLRNATEQYQKITAADPKDLESWLMLGRLQRVARNSVESQNAYKKVLELEADNEEALTGLALVYSDLGDTRNAIDMLRRVNDKNPSSRTLVALASSYERMHDYANAAKTLVRALELTPDNVELKRAARSEPAVLRSTGREPETVLGDRGGGSPRSPGAPAHGRDLPPEARVRQSRAIHGQGQGDRPHRYRDPLHRGEPARIPGEAGRSRGGDEVHAGRYRQEVLLGLGKGKPGDAGGAPGAAGALGGAQRGRRRSFPRTGDAGPGFRQPRRGSRDRHVPDDPQLQAGHRGSRSRRRKYPKDRLVTLAYASLLAETGRVQPAADELRGLLGGDRDREVYLSMAQVFEKGKQFRDMAAALDQAEKLSSDPQEKEAVLFMRGAMLEKMKDFDSAEAEFRKVLAANPENAGALNYLGYMLADRNVRLEEALKMIRKAVDLDPQNGAYLDSLGWVYFRMNRLEEAEASLRQALDRISTDPTVYDHLGDVYMKQGRLKDAIAQWESSLKHWETSPQSEMDPAEVAKVNRKLEGAKVRLAKEQGAHGQKTPLTPGAVTTPVSDPLPTSPGRRASRPR